jgi:hypothetical protein
LTTTPHERRSAPSGVRFPGGEPARRAGWRLPDERLHEWAGDSDERLGFLADKILGTINWDKSLGRPATSRLSEGFIVQHAYSRLKVVVEGTRSRGSWDAHDLLDCLRSKLKDESLARRRAGLRVLRVSGFPIDAV